MTDPEVSNVTFNYCERFICDLYRLATKFSSQLSSLTPSDINSFNIRFRDLERYWLQMETAYTVITANCTDDAQRTAVETKVNRCSEMVYSIKTLHCHISVDSKQKQVSHEFHLPKIALTRFNGFNVEWPNFINIFNSLIHNNERLSSIEKMHYLLSVLDKDPLSMVKHLSISSENYLVAYDILVQRYENKRIIADKYVETILSLPNLTQNNLKNLSRFINTIKENTQALQALQFDIQSWSFLLLHIILKKLPVELRTKFESSIDTSNLPTFKQLLNFLENQLRILENVGGSSSRSSAGNHTLSIVDSDKPQFKVNNYGACPCCKEHHAIYRCSKFDNMTPSQRKNFVVQHKLCFNCLRPHQVSKCSSTSVCQVCRGHHHTKLHVSNHAMEIQHLNPTPAPIHSEPAVSTHGSTVQPQTLHGVNGTFTMVLGTAFVSVQDVDGHFHSARALIDSGSQVSIMTENLAQRLKLPRTQSGGLCGLGASSVPETRGLVSCNVKSTRDSSQVLSSNFIILRWITGHMPSVTVEPKVLKLCRNLVLADVSFTVPGRVDLLLGIEFYDQILDGRKFSLGDHMPTAYSSIFGWIIMGKAPAASQYADTTTSMACTMDLNASLNRFWEVEEPPKIRIQDPQDIQCEKHFKETYIRDSDGRFQVSLPFKVDHKPLGDTHLTALKRFHNLERKLLREPQLRELYIAFMQDYVEAGHMREVSCPSSNGRYFIPHHGVLKEHSTSTKCRAVFDASAPSSNGVALNQVLMSGPKLQQNIEDIILRFRLHGVVFTCDIKQMYRQVRMSDSDCKYQTILWRKSPDEQIKMFELTTVTYGVSSSAFQAIRVLHELAYLNADKHPDVSRTLLQDTFVDDVVSGASDINSAKNLAQSTADVLAQGGFLLRKWSSNSDEFLEGFPVDHRESPYRFVEDGDIFKVLRIEWNANNDCFVYHVSEMSKVLTKRGVLSNIARLYDPCGFLSPVTFFAKLFMQRLWSIETGWDDPLPSDISKMWLEFMSDFPNLNRISIPRCVVTDQLVSSQLLGFSDASERGYAACVYLRAQSACGRVLVQLLLAKSRVAPLKQKLTVPKLELNGALLLARLLEHVLNLLNGKLSLDSTMAWSDSTIVLSWLKSSPHKLQTYEGNRVSQIQSLMPNIIWRHVPSAQNPADSASRGLSPSELASHTLWWSPAWLEDDPSSWPGDFEPISDDDLPGLKPTSSSSSYTVQLASTVTKGQVSDSTRDSEDLLTKFSSFPKLQVTVAWCKRFIHNARNPTQRLTGSLSVVELNDSVHTIVKLVQFASFAETLTLLRANKVAKGALIRLNLFLDSTQLIRVGGRLVKSDLEYDSKHPLLLPKSHHVTRLIVDHYHRMFLHPGLNLLLSLIQSKF